MTFHIGLSARAGSVMLSDSQGSTETSETHGVQKQYVGDGFLVGGAGSSLVLGALFDALGKRFRADDPAHLGVALTAFIERFFEVEVRSDARERAEILIVTPSTDGKAVQRFVPGALTRFGKSATMDLIGSGAPFAVRAVQRDRAIGVDWSMGSLSDLLVFAHDCADAANESLTVNDKLLVGLLVGNRAYAMGGDVIRPAHIPQRLSENWRLVSNYYKRDLLPVIQSIRDARRHAYRAFSQILSTDPDPDAAETIEEHRASLAVDRAVAPGEARGISRPVRWGPRSRCGRHPENGSPSSVRQFVPARAEPRSKAAGRSRAPPRTLYRPPGRPLGID